MPKMRKIVLNQCYGCFELSFEAQQLYAKYANIELYRYTQSNFSHSDDLIRLVKKPKKSKDISCFIFLIDLGDDLVIEPRKFNFIQNMLWCPDDIPRDDPNLVRVVEELGDEANTERSQLEIYSIPWDAKFTIHELEEGEGCNRGWEHLEAEWTNNIMVSI